MSTGSIAIVGAGLSGLICARILQRNGIPVTVYEADATPDSRQQGGSLDIHEDTGQIALKAAGLYEEFRARTHVGGEDMRLLDKTGRCMSTGVNRRGEVAGRKSIGRNWPNGSPRPTIPTRSRQTRCKYTTHQETCCASNADAS